MVTAALVKELREKTGAGMMDCKKVLTETDGDLEKAAELLREKGITKAAKKSGRVAAEGMVEAYISEDEKVGAIVEVNSETDFVAKNEEFRTFVMDVAKQIVKNNPESVEALLAEPAMFEEGKTVNAGDVIGYLGMTGYSTKENVNNINVPHLHFGMQLIFDGSQVDSPNEIWIDVYQIIEFLKNSRSEVYMNNKETKDYVRKYAFNENTSF